MGVSGSGKTTVGKLLADSCGWEFSDADNFHSKENIEKMGRGIPLSEADRIPWLQDLQTAIKHWLQENKNVVLACSALKDSYRQFLTFDSAIHQDCFQNNYVQIVYLKGSYEIIQKRLQERENHYMSEILLDSQFDTLEEPLNSISMDIQNSPQVIVEDIRAVLNI
ncbi:gluconate kinase, SKI family [Calothrix sp. PCC 6303]|nr:gluconate kinase, SKI family [Calothrix sp. PCC 6303]